VRVSSTIVRFDAARHREDTEAGDMSLSERYSGKRYEMSDRRMEDGDGFSDLIIRIAPTLIEKHVLRQ
jgi:hypothetical protein